MNFDKSKVYTSVNADELKPGDKVIVANSPYYLKEQVLEDDVTDEIVSITSDTDDKRFRVDRSGAFALAYLVERAENCTNCHYAYLKDEGIECALNDEPKPTLLYEDAKLNRCRAWGKRAEPKTEQKAEHKCETCKYKNCGLKDCNTANICDRWEAEKHYRPFQDTNELIDCWYEKKFPSCPGFMRYSNRLTNPSIWVRSKFNKGHRGVQVCNFFDEYVELNRTQCYLSRLFDEYTFLDGSPCGVEVKE